MNLFGYHLTIDLWTIFGIVLVNGLFTGRVLLQWYSSEKQGKSVVPVAFWWMSLAGALAGLIYSLHRGETPFVIGFVVTLIPYVRNLSIHYRPNRPPRSMRLIIPVALLLIGALAVGRWAQEGSLKSATAKSVLTKLRGGNAIALDNEWKLKSVTKDNVIRLEVPLTAEMQPAAFGAAMGANGTIWTLPAGLKDAPRDKDHTNLERLIAAHPPVELVRGWWFYFAFAGTFVFYSRFFIQWIHSERIRKSEMPMAFWIASFAGSLMLLAYSLKLGDLVYIFNFIFNVAPYTRNMMLILKPKAKE